MRSFLLPVDGSEHALQAARFLLDFAREHGRIDVDVANVEPRPVLLQTHGMEEDAIEGHLKARAGIVMDPVVGMLEEAGITCRTHVKLGDVAETIVALAGELGSDAIVMGTRGLGAISRLTLGSVTTKVLHLARLPVICIRSADG